MKQGKTGETAEISAPLCIGATEVNEYVKPVVSAVLSDAVIMQRFQ
jgi:hypothetical protein